MGLFSNPDEAARKEKLKQMEDSRLRFAERCQKAAFDPADMLLISTERGGFVGLCRDKGRFCLIVSPDFGSDAEFTLEYIDRPTVRREDFLEPAEGMGGVFGLGKKGAVGFYLYIDRGGVELAIPVIANKNSLMECVKGKNPLLCMKRRRGNANIVWDMRPIEKGMMKKLSARLDALLA